MTGKKTVRHGPGTRPAQLDRSATACFRDDKVLVIPALHEDVTHLSTSSAATTMKPHLNQTTVEVKHNLSLSRAWQVQLLPPCEFAQPQFVGGQGFSREFGLYRGLDGA